MMKTQFFALVLAVAAAALAGSTADAMTYVGTFSPAVIVDSTGETATRRFAITTFGKIGTLARSDIRSVSFRYALGDMAGESSFGPKSALLVIRQGITVSDRYIFFDFGNPDALLSFADKGTPKALLAASMCFTGGAVDCSGTSSPAVYSTIETVTTKPGDPKDPKNPKGADDLVANQFGYTLKSGVQIIAMAVPEPGSWVLFIAGFGLVGVAVRRQALTPGRAAP
jgi:hypothetical protein